MPISPRRCPDVLAREVAGEHLLVPVRGKLADLQRLYVLDPVARFIWERLDGKRDIRQLAAEIAEAFEVEPDRAALDAGKFIAELREAGLVTA